MSAMAGHSINLGHHIQLHNIDIFLPDVILDLIIRKVIEIEICPSNMSMEDGFCLRKS
jgi:hypothetical protein